MSVAKDAVIGDDLLLLSDASVIKFGTNSDILLTHDADRGLILSQATETTGEPIFTIKNTGDLASGGGIEFLLDNGAGEGDDDVLGFISFKGDNSGNAETQFGKIEVIASDITNTDEGAMFKFSIMSGGRAGTAAMTPAFIIGGEDTANGTSGTVQVNLEEKDIDFQVRGTNVSSLLRTNAEFDRIGIGQAGEPGGFVEIQKSNTQSGNVPALFD